MQLTLQYQKKVREVKEEFNHLFPYLKIEFVAEKKAISGINRINKIASPYATLGAVAGAMKEGVISIEPEATVAAVTQVFQRKFGLPVRIFRKTKDWWTEIKETDNTTLAQQNETGRADAQFFKLKSYRYTMML